MIHATALRFPNWARFGLRSGETVCPLEDRFGPKVLGEASSTQLVVLCEFSTTYGSAGCDDLGTSAGRPIWRAVAFDEIVWITGAVIGDSADALIDVRGEVERDLLGGKAS